MRSKLSSRGRVTVPKEIREYLGFEPGDDVAFERAIGDVVILCRVDPDDAAYEVAVSETLGEWGSDADTEAFRHL